ncbi:MAG: hydrogenase nickel incorporation protein HypA [Candidatus Bathyarchaeota archaeon]|nr:MAG: hydrogenase nickel incorporation protein HypA [Candidatus Bathyarchaeota archaeon]
MTADMHELALAEGVIQTAAKIAEEQSISEITEVIIQVGELQQVDHEVLRFALERLRTPTMRNARFTIESIPGRLKCRICGEEWNFNPESLSEETSEAIHFVPEVAHAYISCPGCGSPDFHVLEGRGVLLASIRGVKRDE